MAHDVFVSHSSLDKLAADAVCHGLEAHGIRCWIAPRDEIAGKSYGEQITSAIQNAKIMVLVFSDNVNKSSAVHNEIDLAAGSNVTIIPFKITDDAFNPELRFYLGRVHWLDAYPLPVNHYIDNLAGMVKRNLPGGDAAALDDLVSGEAPRVAPAQAPAGPPPVSTTGPPAKPPNPTLILAGAGVVVLLALVFVAGSMMRGGSKPGASPAAANATQAGATQVAASSPAAAPDPVDPAAAGIETPQVRYFETVLVKGGPPAALDGATVIDTAELVRKLQRRDQNAENFFLIDARGCTDEETIQGAICLNPNNIGEMQIRVPMGTPVVAFCHDGRCPMSYEMAQAALGSGYQQVFWYRGGINAWAAAGLPTTRFRTGGSE